MTFSFADAGAGLYGLARLGLAGADGERDASALAVLFSGREPVAALAQGGIRVAADACFERLALPGLEATVDEPLQRWTLRFDGGEQGFDLAFAASGPPAAIDPSEDAARAGGMEGYEQLCRVTGTVRAGGRALEVAGLGQRGHTWGEPDWERISSTRTVAAWLDDGTGLALSAVRPAGATGHEPEATWAAVLGAAGSRRVDDPRLSTTYDEDGRQRRAGLELWLGDDDDWPWRGTGVVVCGSTLDLGQLRLDCSFMRWHLEGRPAIGRYDVLRRA